jgi:DNA-directed RNA polymerase subunit RPC12/RpoP
VSVCIGSGDYVCPSCGCNEDPYQASMTQKWTQCPGCGRRILATNFESRTNDSIVEAHRGEALRWSQQFGAIEQLEEQVDVPLPYYRKRGMWKCDFRYREVETGMVVFEDTKGRDTPGMDVLIRLWVGHGDRPGYGPGVLRLVRRVRKQWVWMDYEGGKCQKSQ